MKNQIIVTFFLFTLMSCINATAAGIWNCSDGGKAKCYVSNVRFKPGQDPYVRAKLHNPGGDSYTTCKHIWVRLNQTAKSVEEVRGIEALLLVGLTTGLPISFFVTGRDANDNSECHVSSVVIAKPGN
ncbi:MAG: hypothetical protein GY697_07670 [Desulfobacterales bacterium]|nr:hypothetical protein [Desulfobacterales bacterium]